MSARSAMLLVLGALTVPRVVAAADLQAPPPERYRLRVEYREFRPALRGEIEVGSRGTSSIVDVEQDLAIEDDRTFEIRGAIQVAPGHKLRGSYTRLNYRGDTLAARAFAIQGTRYDVATHVVSSFDGAYYGASYEWDLVRRPGGFVGVVLGARLVDGDWSVEALEQGQREGDEIRRPIPVLGLVGRTYAGRASLEAEITGFTLGDRGRLFEAEASARLHVSDRLAVQGGYRLIDVRGQENEDRGELRVRGWQFGLELSL